MYKCTNLDLREVGSLTSNSKKLNRCRSFHFRYLELCRAKNMTPLPDIRTKNNATSVLEFFGDKLSVNDWLLVVEALYYDQVLQTLCIRLRKTFGMGWFLEFFQYFPNLFIYEIISLQFWIIWIQKRRRNSSVRSR